jgi:hypothetical protein
MVMALPLLGQLSPPHQLLHFPRRDDLHISAIAPPRCLL